MELITCTESYVTIYNQDLDTLDCMLIMGVQDSPNDIIYGNGYWIADDSKGFVSLKIIFHLKELD